MINILNLTSRAINGINYALFELDALTYRPASVKQRQSVVIPALKAGAVQVVDLDNFLKFNLLVTGVDMDVVEDDRSYLENDGRTSENSYWGFLYVNVINRKTLNVIKRLSFQITPFPTYTNEIILSPEHIYEFKPSKDINSITFTGEPVHLRNPLIFKDGTYKEALTARKIKK